MVVWTEMSILGTDRKGLKELNHFWRQLFPPMKPIHPLGVKNLPMETSNLKAIARYI